MTQIFVCPWCDEDHETADEQVRHVDAEHPEKVTETYFGLGAER